MVRRGGQGLHKAGTESRRGGSRRPLHAYTQEEHNLKYDIDRNIILDALKDTEKKILGVREDIIKRGHWDVASTLELVPFKIREAREQFLAKDK